MRQFFYIFKNDVEVGVCCAQDEAGAYERYRTNAEAWFRPVIAKNELQFVATLNPPVYTGFWRGVF